MGDHYRNRLTHTLEVAQISRSIGKVLGLNDELIEAIALGHDLGHTPFGHIGERTLDGILHNGLNNLKMLTDDLERKVSKLESSTESKYKRGLTKLSVQ